MPQYIEVTDEMREAVRAIRGLAESASSSREGWTYHTFDLWHTYKRQLANLVIAAIERQEGKEHHH